MSIDTSSLTAQQAAVLHLVAQGLSNKEIGLRLDIVESTVKIHMRALNRHFGTRNRTELAILVVQSRHGMPVEADTESPPRDVMTALWYIVGRDVYASLPGREVQILRSGLDVPVGHEHDMLVAICAAHNAQLKVCPRSEPAAEEV